MVAECAIICTRMQARSGVTQNMDGGGTAVAYLTLSRGGGGFGKSLKLKPQNWSEIKF